VYSSPQRRALETAAPLARRLELGTVVEPDLREIDFGELEGLSVETVIERYPVESAWMHAPAAAVFPGGESVAGVRERVVAAATSIAQRHTGESVVVFGHAVTTRAILADALAMPVDAMFRLDQSYGGISIVEWFDGRALVRVVNAVRL
jgi:broad specificity phosphatase PhoE